MMYDITASFGGGQCRRMINPNDAVALYSKGNISESKETNTKLQNITPRLSHQILMIQSQKPA
jgi:hypothetical protein